MEFDGWISGQILKRGIQIKMAKKEISKKLSKSGANMKSLKKHKPFSDPALRSREAISEALADCLLYGDIQAFREVLASHIIACDKTALAKKSKVGRRTIYDILDFEKPFNPGILTLSSIVKAIAA